MRNNEPVLIVFAKKPELGKVKTRLCPPLSSLQAMQVAKFVIKKSIENFSKHWLGEVELCVWPDSNDVMIEALCADFGIAQSAQVSGDLGEKMYAAIFEKIGMGHNAMVIGADVPHCSAQILKTAYKALKADKNVIGPTVDGGYYCIGVNNPKATMFENVSWGSEQAYAQTLSSCAHENINFDVTLPRLNDLDDFKDLQEISIQLPELNAIFNEKNG